MRRKDQPPTHFKPTATHSNRLFLNHPPTHPLYVPVHRIRFLRAHPQAFILLVDIHRLEATREETNGSHGILNTRELGVAQLSPHQGTDLGGWVGGWVGELCLHRKVEENEAVQRRCCLWGLGGWVGGTYLHSIHPPLSIAGDPVTQHIHTPNRTLPAAHHTTHTVTTCWEKKRVGGWVGG